MEKMIVFFIVVISLVFLIIYIRKMVTKGELCQECPKRKACSSQTKRDVQGSVCKKNETDN